MTEVLAVTLPFFALVGMGYAAARLRLLPLDSIAGLNVFVLFFALPCMLFQFGAQTPIAQLFNPVVLGLWLGVALIMVGMACWLARKAGFGWRDAAFGALVATFPNTGFMGVPLILGLLGPAAAGPTIAAIMMDMVVTSSLCVALAHMGQGAARAVTGVSDSSSGVLGAASGSASGAGDSAERGSGLRAVRQALVGVAKNPMPWSVLAGALASALHWVPPKPVATTVGLLAAAATPVALFSIGAVLWRSRRETLLQQGKLGGALEPRSSAALASPEPHAQAASSAFSAPATAPACDESAPVIREAGAAVPVPVPASARAPATSVPAARASQTDEAGAVVGLSPQALRRDLIVLVALKLFAHPLLVAAGLWLLARAGAAVPTVVQVTLLLVAALPSAGNVSLLAERFGADNGRVARVILWTTLIAVLSFNAVVLLVLPRG